MAASSILSISSIVFLIFLRSHNTAAIAARKHSSMITMPVLFIFCHPAITDSIDAVSYTHLDVYKRQVYISCNPETLARDLKYLTKHGYQAKECQPVDLFPWTKPVSYTHLDVYKRQGIHRADLRREFVAALEVFDKDGKVTFAVKILRFM